METFSISSRFAPGIPTCLHEDTDIVTLQSLDSVAGTIHPVQKYWGHCVGFDWGCGQVGSGHESSKVKYLLKESLGEQSSYFVYF